MNYDDEPSLWGPDGIPHPNHIGQGYLGDCWFLAAAAAIAEWPDLVKGVFAHDELLPQGISRQFFWVKDRWVTVNIDDRLPSSSSRTMFVNPTRGAWWMPLLEKAYAKLDVNYDRIVGGWG